jgi:hypothetical protein
MVHLSQKNFEKERTTQKKKQNMYTQDTHEIHIQNYFFTGVVWRIFWCRVYGVPYPASA